MEVHGMRPAVITFSIFLGVLGAVSVLPARAAEDECRPGGCSLDLAVKNIGLSFGNSRRFNGLRLNLVDDGVEEMNGVNVTLWKPGRNPDAAMRGLMLGLVAINAADLRGVSIGGLAVVGESCVEGISIAGLASVAEGSITGISIAGLASVAEGNMAGISLAGLASVTEKSMTGISIAGLAAVAERSMTGISVAGLAIAGEDEINGLAASLGSIISDGDINGVALGAVGLLGLRSSRSEDDEGYSRSLDISPSFTGIRARNVRWLAIHGMDIRAEDSLLGMGISGIALRADEIRGGAVAGIVVKTRDLGGVSISSVNYVDGPQIGVSIGIVNYARELRGFQLGLLNIAKNNPRGLRVLPVLNAHL
jgi:hypothetical protein